MIAPEADKSQVEEITSKVKAMKVKESGKIAKKIRKELKEQKHTEKQKNKNSERISEVKAPSVTQSPGMEIRSPPTDLPGVDLAWQVAERTSTGLQNYAATGDVRHMLLIQRHLVSVQDGNGDT